MPDEQDRKSSSRSRLAGVGQRVRTQVVSLRDRIVSISRTWSRNQSDVARHRVESPFARRVIVATAVLLGVALTAVAANAALVDDDPALTTAYPSATPLDENALLNRGADDGDRSDRTSPSPSAEPSDEPTAEPSEDAKEPAEEATGKPAPEPKPSPSEAETDATKTDETRTEAPEPKPSPSTQPEQKPDWVHPMPGAATTSCYGMRWGVLHAGVDLAQPAGTPIRAVGAGTVVNAGWAFSGYGISVVIDHHNGYLTHYAHASEATVSVGQEVEPGQTIALEGSTGDSTGPHLHFEVHQGMWNQVEPTSWMREHGVAIGGC